MKKFGFFAMAAVAMVMVSCGGNKQEATDSESVVVEDTVVAETAVAVDSDTIAVVEEEVAVAEVKSEAKKPATVKKDEPKKNDKFNQPVSATVKEKAPAAATQQPAQATSQRAGVQQGFNQAAQAGQEQATGVKKRFEK